MSEHKVKVMLNMEILNKINDQGAALVLRNVLFSSKNRIDWNDVYNLMVSFMPELKEWSENDD